MIDILAKSGAVLILVSAAALSFLYFLGIIVGMMVFIILLLVMFVLIAGVLAVYYSLTKKPNLEKKGDWGIERVRGK